jgi:hypothetical protein
MLSIKNELLVLSGVCDYVYVDSEMVNNSENKEHEQQLSKTNMYASRM